MNGIILFVFFHALIGSRHIVPDPSLRLNVTVIHLFSSLYDITVCEYTIMHLLILLLMGIQMSNF